MTQPTPVPEQGAISRGMAWMFGASWKTTVYGTIAALSTGVVGIAVAISQAATTTGASDVDPFLQFLLYSIPSKTRAYVIIGASVIAFISGQRFAKHAKATNVTGGTLQQDAAGQPAKVQEPTPAPPLPASPPSPLSEHREDSPAPRVIE